MKRKVFISFNGKVKILLMSDPRGKTWGNYRYTRVLPGGDIFKVAVQCPIYFGLLLIPRKVIDAKKG